VPVRVLSRWNVFDLTKVWPQKEVPLRRFGRFTLNKNPQNYFAAVCGIEGFERAVDGDLLVVAAQAVAVRVRVGEEPSVRSPTRPSRLARNTRSGPALSSPSSTL
jgi:hypothetical protein